MVAWARHGRAARRGSARSTPMKLAALLAAHAALTLDKQRALAALIGPQHQWQFSMDSGILRFNGVHAFPAQIIGTESTAAKTWLWSWANRGSSIPAPLLKAALALKAAGAAQEVVELTTPELLIGRVSPGQLMSVATGLTGSDAYYRGTYDGGAIYLVFSAPVLQEKAERTSQRVVSVFTQLISSMPMDHRAAWVAYLAQKGYEVEEHGEVILGRIHKNESVEARFDRQGRVLSVGTVLKR
jgi:hypothetical protein